MRRAAHRALDLAVRAITPSDGGTPFRPATRTGEPDEFFSSPGLPESFRVEEVRRARVGRTRALRKRFAFASPVRTGVGQNDTVRGYWLSPLQDEVRGSIVFLHQWKATNVRPVRRMVEQAVRNGAELLVPAQPYHAWRRPRLTYSGLTMLGPDLDHSLRSMRQAVLDVRRLLLWLQERDQGPIVLAGVDLGGLVASLVATVHPGLSGLVVVAAHDRIAEMLWDRCADGGHFRGAVERAGLGPREVGEAWSVLDPGFRPPLVPRDRVVLVGGRFDEACSAEGIERLAARWGGVRVEWLDFAHRSWKFVARAIMKESLSLLGPGAPARGLVPAAGEGEEQP